MSETNVRRNVLLAIVGISALAAVYLGYTQYSTKSSNQTQLHRSNAVRRPRARRRWRRGYQQQQDLSEDATERALSALQQRTTERRGYGLYRNSWIFPVSDDTDGLDLTLTPSNLDTIFETLSSRYPEWTPYQQQSLRAHIHATFVQNFLQIEYPEGYIIGDDVTTLEAVLSSLGVQAEVISILTEEFDTGSFPMSEHWRPIDEPPSPRPPVATQTDGAADNLNPQDVIQALSGDRVDNDQESEVSVQRTSDEDVSGSQNMLDLLYHIAGEQAKRDGYIHRGVECNSCGACPIQGIRYHCANCFDYDLCETCEANQVHARNHVFYKVRIPAPQRGHIKQVAPKWYPGNPNAFPLTLSPELSKELLAETGMDRTEMDALYEQFKCLAGHPWPSDPSQLGMAIDRRGFDMYFTPNNADRPSLSSLIHDRIFAFYDTNDDGLIGFKEYICGLANLQNKSRMARLKRIFQGYDIDSDGFVDRKDFLRIFRAYYILSKELNREMYNSQEDFGYIDDEIREVIQGSQPISAVFGGSVLYGHESRPGEDKQLGQNGDLIISNGPTGVLQNDVDPRGDRARAISNAAIGRRPRGHPFRSFRVEPPADEPLMQMPIQGNNVLLGIQHADDASESDMNGPEPPLQTYGWPPLLMPEQDDIITALGHDIPFDEITDPVDRSRIFYAQSQRLDAESDRYLDWSRRKALRERWKRRHFYLDEEEGMSKPAGYFEPDSSDDEEKDKKTSQHAIDGDTISRRQSMRSRSSSKVRFDDSAIDTDYETRSNASSRSIPRNERWGGVALGHPEVDIGKDILYEAVQQGFNEMLDSLFKSKEDEAMEAQATRRLRNKWASQLNDYENALNQSEQVKIEALRQADMLRTEELMKGADAQDPPENTVEAKKPGVTFDDESSSEESEPPDPNDHIELMFLSSLGMAPRKNNDSSSPNSKAAMDRDDDSASDSIHDPTLPQFRPDGDKIRHRHRAALSNVPPSNKDLERWLLHKKVDEEAEARGGYGKLNFNEFRIRMVIEDEIGNALKGEENTTLNDPSVWETSADLGKLAFVGTWLEMASF